MSRATAWRTVSRALAAAIAAVLLADVGAIAERQAQPAPRAAAVQPPRQRVTPVADEQRRAQERDASLKALLDRRAAAVLHHDKVAFLDTVDPEATAFLAAQGRLFDNLADVPLATWFYELQTGAAHQLPADVAARYGTSASSTAYAPAGVYLHYELRGFDEQPTAALQYLTFVQRPSGWYVASDTDFDRLGLPTTRELWDFGPVRAVHGAHSLVLGHPGSLPLMRELAAETDRDIPRVDAVWGTAWSQRAVVLVPSTDKELNALVGDDSDLSQIAAVATAELPGRAGPAGAVGDRVIVSPANFAKLGDLGRRVVMTHEVTHVATRAATGTAMPDWLVEGFADYVGYRDTGVAPGDAARELGQEVRAGQVPQALPADGEFSGNNGRLPQVYEEAWLACRLAAKRGDGTLVRLYRAVGSTEGVSARVALERGLHDVLGTTTAQFTAQWRDYVRTSLS